ncbi:hypothetical protein INR49_015555 [Caranx melampygus]|nr:hypothetical protein INR49_015555 [Caranx melampygus]
MRLSNLSSLDHNSKISCTAENIVERRIPPKITKLSDAIPDHHWCIPFSVSGNPEPNLQWFMDDQPVTEGLYIMTMIHDITEREYHGCLQLDSPTHLNNGRYRLVATNKFGTDKRRWKLTSCTGLGMRVPLQNHLRIESLKARVGSNSVYVVVGIAAVAFTGFLLMLVILKFGGNSKFGIKGKTCNFHLSGIHPVGKDEHFRIHVKMLVNIIVKDVWKSRSKTWIILG